jgi:pilus assembly protein Flp/PilA
VDVSYNALGIKKVMKDNLKRFLSDERGVTAIEYGILAAAMAAAIGVIFGSDGVFVTALKDRFSSIADQITNTNNPGSE